MIGMHHLFRPLVPFVVMGAGIYLLERCRRRCRRRMRQRDETQAKILQTLGEIRDELREKKS